MRDAEESVPVGSKEPPAVASRPVCSWLFKPTSNLSLDTSDCLEAVPIPEKYAALFARLPSQVSCPPLRALVSCGLADRRVTRKYTRVRVGL